jgi:hypothetical protein
MVAAGVPTPATTTPCDGSHGARHARGDALERRGRPPGTGAADRDQLGPVVAGVIGRSGSSTTCGATRSTPRAGWSRTARPVESRSRGATYELVRRRVRVRAAGHVSRSRARARWRSGTSSAAGGDVSLEGRPTSEREVDTVPQPLDPTLGARRGRDVTVDRWTTSPSRSPHARRRHGRHVEPALRDGMPAWSPGAPTVALSSSIRSRPISTVGWRTYGSCAVPEIALENNRGHGSIPVPPEPTPPPAPTATPTPPPVSFMKGAQHGRIDATDRSSKAEIGNVANAQVAVGAHIRPNPSVHIPPARRRRRSSRS